MNGNNTTVINDLAGMLLALDQAKQAAKEGEVPVGAVLVYKNRILSTGHNQMITHCDPSAHAEIQALRKGGKTLKNYRLLGTTLYVTLEPCAMCLGALVHARISRLVFGADDPKAGAIKSVAQLLDFMPFNHQFTWVGNVAAVPCSKLLRQFFQEKRQS